MDLNESPQNIMDTFDGPGSEFSLDPSQKRFIYPTFRFGVDANIERYSVGFGVDMSLGDMDKFLLSDYRSIYMSVGYKLWRR